MKRFCLALSVLALFVGAQAASAQRPGGGFGGFGGGGAAGLVRMEEVQKELKITDEQKTKLTEGLRGAGGGRDAFQGKSREEIQKLVEEATKKAEDLVKTVLDAKQQERLGELRIQREGAAALARAEVATKLALSDEQKEKIKKLQADATPARGGGLGQGASQEDRQKAFAEMREKREKANAEIVAVLTAEQKTAFEKLQGEKFTFPQGGPGGRPRNNNN